MSAAGHDAAVALSALDPERASTVAAELRNAITPAALTLVELERIAEDLADRWAARHAGKDPAAEDLLDLLESVRATVYSVIAVADALRPEASHEYQDLQRDPDGVVEALGIGRVA